MFSNFFHFINIFQISFYSKISVKSSYFSQFLEIFITSSTFFYIQFWRYYQFFCYIFLLYLSIDKNSPFSQFFVKSPYFLYFPYISFTSSNFYFKTQFSLIDRNIWLKEIFLKMFIKSFNTQLIWHTIRRFNSKYHFKSLIYIFAQHFNLTRNSFFLLKISQLIFNHVQLTWCILWGLG